MGMRGWFSLLLGLLILAIGALFYVQNSLRVVDLSLNLGFVAFKLQEPVAVPLALLASFGAGLLGGVIVMLLARRAPVESARAGATSSSGGDLWT